MQGSDNYHCPVCTEAYDSDKRKPLRLECGHAECKVCFGFSHRTESRVLCGRCSHATFSNRENEDYTISALIASSEVKCSNCGRSMATQYCEQHDKAHCPRCTPLPDCRMTPIDSEDFSLRHYLYSRILIFKNNLNRQLQNSPLLGEISRIEALTNQERLNLLKNLMSAETQIQCFTCSEQAAGFDQGSLTICCAKHMQLHPGALQLRKQDRDQLIQQLKHFIRMFLKTVSNSFFDPDTAKMVKVINGLKASATVYDIANVIYLLSNTKQKNEDFSQSGRVQCPMCYKVNMFQQVQMARLPCSRAIHLICCECYTENRSSLVCPFDGERIPPSAVVTYHFHY